MKKKNEALILQRNTEMDEEIVLSDMIDELCEYAECAGFADFYEKKVKGLSKEEFIKLYNDVLEKTDSKPFVRDKDFLEIKNNYVPTIEISSSNLHYVSKDGFEYRTLLYMKLKDNTAIEWQLDEPFDITKGVFTNLKTNEDLYNAIYNMVVTGDREDDSLLIRDELPDVSQLATIFVQETCDHYGEPQEDDILLEDEYFGGFMGYDFINNKSLEKPPYIQDHIDRMIYELVMEVEESGDKDYYDRELKYKTDMEIIDLYYSKL